MPEDDPILGAYLIAPWLEEDAELYRDLVKGYLNPEVFANPNLDQIYQTCLIENILHYSNRAPAEAVIVWAQINGKSLPFSLRESLFWRYVSGANLDAFMKHYGAKTFAQLRIAIQSDPKFSETDKAIGAFFIRNFPALLRSTYEILSDVAICAALLREVDDKKAKDRTLKKILKRHTQKLENQIKGMIGTRKRGGSKGRLEVNKRRSLHTQYDEFLQIAKGIKRHYGEIFHTFDRNRKTYKRDQWREFWLSHATQIYDYDSEFLALFSEAGNSSASDIAYQWLSVQTGHAVSYVKQLVLKSRKEKKVTFIRSE